jgi:MFS family permease
MNRLQQRVVTVYRDYPSTFWTLVGASFVDALGGAVLFPFFALYVTANFGVGMTEAGALFTIFAISGIVGGMLGGALTDRFGRRGIVIFSLISSALSSLTLGFVDDLRLLYGLALFVGLFSRMGRPAREAMVADLLPEEKQTEGYGVLRVVHNLAIALGPAIGGFIASRSYLGLFITDATGSVITAVLVYFLLPETRPAPQAGVEEESAWGSVRGYLLVLRDVAYMAFVFISVLLALGYTQLFSTLSVYLRDFHGVPDQGYGWLLTTNATMVVLLQFWVTRRVRGVAPLPLLAGGSLFYAAGLALFGLVSAYPLFLLGIIIATTGELLVKPTAQAMVARLAPLTMRGRYMAIYGFTWPISQAIGPLAAGLIMDNLDPRLVWFAGAALALVAGAGFLGLRSMRAQTS